MNRATASACVAANVVAESPMEVTTAPRASGWVGSKHITGDRVFMVSVSGYQLPHVVVIGHTVTGAAKQMRRRRLMTVLQWNASRWVETSSHLVVIHPMGVAEGIQ
jgi:hypothetical protein